jgi:hypothetical protein
MLAWIGRTPYDVAAAQISAGSVEPARVSLERPSCRPRAVALEQNEFQGVPQRD